MGDVGPQPAPAGRGQGLDALAAFGELFPAALLVVDAGGVVRAANARAQELTDRTEQELVGRAVDELVAGDAASLSELLERAAERSTWTSGAAVVTRARQGERTCGASAVRAPFGEAVLLQLVELEEGESGDGADLMDLSREVSRSQRSEALLAGENVILERIAREERLDESLEAMALEVESHTDGLAAAFLRFDEELRTMRCIASPSLPPAFRETFAGVELDVVHPLAASHVPFAVADVQTDSRWSALRRGLSEAGVRSVWSTPIRSEDGVLLGAFLLTAPTRREPSEVERALLENTASVAGVAISRHDAKAERARLLGEAESGRRTAEAATASKDRFLATASHELRSPLGAMMVAAEALATTAPGPEQVAGLHRVLLRQGAIMRRILDDLLVIARNDAGALELEREVLRLDEAARECVDALAKGAESNGVTVQLVSEPVSVDADPVRIEQVLRNVCENAIKYSDGRGTVRVTVSERDGAASVVVEDEGIGIEPSSLATIFEPFERAPEAAERVERGVGLGLPLAQRLVVSHGGRIRVESDGRGLGTRVTIELPLGARAGAEVEARASRAADDGTPRPRTVVVVEDNEDARESLLLLLRRWGHRVDGVAEGEGALAAVEEAKADVALVDVGLPGIDGYEVARRLRRSDVGADATLVAMTGFGRPEDRARAIQAGFDAHLVKPIDFDALRRLLAEARGGG